MFIHESCGIIDFVVDHKVQVLLRRVLCDLSICEFLVGRHVEPCLVYSGKSVVGGCSTISVRREWRESMAGYQRDIRGEEVGKLVVAVVALGKVTNCLFGDKVK
jgi:hypothetical protein